MCSHSAVTSAKSGDGCCPASANATNDSDCQPVCGNGVVESGEICDGNCPTKCTQDNDACTASELAGTGCGVTCKVRQLTREPAGNCNDGKECTDDVQIESTSQCIYICKHNGKPAGTACSNGGKCSGTLANSCDVPVVVDPVCGDGFKQGIEQCDEGRDTWECTADCRTRNQFVICSKDDDCGGAERCVTGACTVACKQWPDGQGICPTPSVPPNAVPELKCWNAGNGTTDGWCRPACETDSGCPRGMKCVPDQPGVYGGCFPG